MMKRKTTRWPISRNLREVERNDKDASKPVARHFNLPNNSKQNMVICCLSLKKKLIFQIGILNPHRSNERFSFNQFILGFLVTTHIPNHIFNPQSLPSPWRRANARNVSFLTLYGSQCTLSTQLIILNYPAILSYQRITTVTSETYPLFLYNRNEQTETYLLLTSFFSVRTASYGTSFFFRPIYGPRFTLGPSIRAGKTRTVSYSTPSNSVSERFLVGLSAVSAFPINISAKILVRCACSGFL